ncbi:solute carrier family 22 member 18-like [Dendronephthya gigantea]|uniref:solute carrier family 22 member 18-like n=1 Tax=Dendronephthya gigantea TaxID=151771 RepID=UPI00106B4C9A|nr:solute carrier family 22 member 18-like [Dendronephthya gigantea]
MSSVLRKKYDDLKSENTTVMSEEIDHDSKNDENFASEEKPQPKRRLLVFAVHFCNVLYSSCFWINIGVYPYITKSLGIDMVTYGYLQTVFGALQLLGGPIYGRLGDMFGSRAVLMLAHSCGFFIYFLLAIASSPAMLFLARVPGIFMHGAQGAQMVMTDLTSHKERAVALGQLGFSYGAGVILGPFIGGQISKYFSKNAALMSAAFLSVFAVGFVMMFIPKFTRQKTESNPKQQASPVSLFDVKRIKELMLIPGVGLIYVMKLISGLPFGIFQSMFSLVVVNTFGLTPAQHGMFMSYIGSLMILVQGFGVGFVTKRMNEKNTLVLAMILCSFGYVLLFFSSRALHLCVMVVPLVFGGALFGVITNSILTKLVPAEDTGFALGISFATHALIRTIAPTVGGILLHRFGYTSFGTVGFVVCLGTALFLFLKQNIQTES